MIGGRPTIGSMLESIRREEEAEAARLTKWDHRFMHSAYEMGSWSKDPGHKVGCVVVDDDRNLVSEGYNGFARGVEDSTERYIDRDLELLLTVHAEANAVATAARSGRSLKGCTAYVTLRPCCQCSALLIQAGVRCVVVPAVCTAGPTWVDNLARAEAMLLEAGVKYVRLA